MERREEVWDWNIANFAGAVSEPLPTEINFLPRERILVEEEEVVKSGV